jgi:TetR/AcrR family tetracycline transcriptional repressor
VIETGLRLLNEAGLDGLTVRRLAAELDVKSPALYWHFRTKQELLDGMADAIIVAAGMGPPEVGEPWQRWLARRARAYRQSLLAYRDGARVVTNSRSLSPTTVQMFGEELTALVGQGFTPVQALRAISSITHFTNGFVLQEQTITDRRPANAPDGVPDIVIEAVRDSGGVINDDTFEHGVRLLIDGAAVALGVTPLSSILDG